MMRINSVTMHRVSSLFLFLLPFFLSLARTRPRMFRCSETCRFSCVGTLPPALLFPLPRPPTLLSPDRCYGSVLRPSFIRPPRPSVRGRNFCPGGRTMYDLRRGHHDRPGNNSRYHPPRARCLDVDSLLANGGAITAIITRDCRESPGGESLELRIPLISRLEAYGGRVNGPYTASARGFPRPFPRLLPPDHVSSDHFSIELLTPDLLRSSADYPIVHVLPSTFLWPATIHESLLKVEGLKLELERASICPTKIVYILFVEVRPPEVSTTAFTYFRTPLR
ncbi:hypothetical protein PUN28_019452 [Cardiocondyla obscurior]|uniref:Uncharacterized protein n=1 Tax=Cardiocondyla obscurior TaxID=286306 RepID=A0AAW2EAF8_9HYME